ncbi:hypothetical protein MTP99_008857 [Tenebrio molitor]|uniref:Odorant receptor n=1 Tax=Tenebrio molitor TaxID=7067 RepID=A0A8J6HUK9_TENMO|nr:hypothetical protein GEV33_001884 [Tenebrio molitor]KAJ3636002.1 hypothetical protein MTP99_008857 [Tenebrio molitor]
MEIKKFNWKSAISVNTWFLKLIGLWPGPDLYKMNKYTFYMIFVIFLINSHIFFQAANAINAYKNLKALITIMFTIFTKLLTSAKMLMFVRKSGTLQRFMLQMESEEFQPKNDQQVMMVQRLLKSWKKVYFVFWVMALCIVSLRTFFPLLDGTVKDYRLPLRAWYPYDYKTSPLYEITYLHQVICDWISATATVNTDTFIAALMMCIGTQCDILSDNLRHLTNCEDDGEFNKKLVDCIEHHKKIVRFAIDCNSFFNEIVLGQFVASSLTLALTMFEVTVVEPLSIECFALMSYVSGACVETFQYCWFGQEVQARVSHQ